MMTDQPLSPRAEKLKFWISRSRGVAYAVALAAAALLPAVPAHGSEAPASGMMVQRGAAALRLPATPYLETTPWLNWEPYRHGLKVDTLLLPASPLDHRLDGHWHRIPLDLPTS